MRAPGRHALVPLAFAFAIACAAPATLAPARTERPEPAAHPVAGWPSWPTASKKRFQSKGHGYLWVEVRIAPGFHAVYDDPSRPVPPGFQVVMAGYENPGAPLPTGLTLMAKLAGGEWHFASLAPDGRQAAAQGRLEVCIGCHRHAPRDHLFGLAR